MSLPHYLCCYLITCVITSLLMSLFPYYLITCVVTSLPVLLPRYSCHYLITFVITSLPSPLHHYLCCLFISHVVTSLPVSLPHYLCHHPNCDVKRRTGVDLKIYLSGKKRWSCGVGKCSEPKDLWHSSLDTRRC